jgi:hypothetical protein
MLLIKHDVISPLHVLVASMNHFSTQHQLQKKEGRLMEITNPLQGEVNVREHIPSNAIGSMLLIQSNNMITPLIVPVANMNHFAIRSKPSNARGGILLIQSNNMITPLIVPVASMIHFATQHQLQKREGRLMEIANLLQ